jgi:hypothetical protein
MKKRIFVMLAAAAVAAATTGIAIAASQKSEQKRSFLIPANGSGVTGTVQLRANDEGGTDIRVVARGLQPGGQYASFYYDDHHCSVGPDLVGTFTANSSGTGFVVGEADDPIDDIGSVSVRTPDYSVLFACAPFG